MKKSNTWNAVNGKASKAPQTNRFSANSSQHLVGIVLPISMRIKEPLTDFIALFFST